MTFTLCFWSEDKLLRRDHIQGKISNKKDHCFIVSALHNLLRWLLFVKKLIISLHCKRCSFWTRIQSLEMASDFRDTKYILIKFAQKI